MDGALAGGTWAAEGSFAVPNLAWVTTALVTDMSGTTATGGGEVVSEGDSPVTARGVCWNTSGTPTVADSHTGDGSGSGSFTSMLTGLTDGQTYYIRAYATSAVGTGYGPQRSFYFTTVAFTLEPPGKTLAFSSSSSQYVTVANAADLQGPSHYTLECWFKAGSVSGLQGLISKSAASRDGGWYLRLNGTELEFDGLATGGSGVQTGLWYHAAAVNDGGTRRLYVNGAEQTRAGTAVTVNATYTPLTLACDQGTNYFSGKLDEVRVWNVARTQQEVRENMHLTGGGRPGLVAYYSFDAISGTTLSDDAQPTVSHLGTLVNMSGSEWAVSTLPAGRGAAASQTETAGTVAFAAANLSATFTAAGTAELTVTRIDAGPPHDGPKTNVDMLASYWVVERFGTGSFAADLTFTADGSLSASDEADPSSVALFRRTAASDGAWIQVAAASSVSAAGQTVTFEGLTDFGQFVIGHNAGSFPEQTGSGLPPVHANSMAWGDYDNDGKLDLLVSGNFAETTKTLIGDFQTRIYHNNGDGTFTEDTTADAGLPGTSRGAVAWGDYDNDGWLDFVLAGHNPGLELYYFKMYHNNGDGTFTENTQANLIQSGPADVWLVGGVAWGDYDNDGRLDLVVMGQEADGKTGPRIYHNDGGGVFTEDTAADAELAQVRLLAMGQVAWGDYNGDGRLDLLLLGCRGEAPGIVAAPWYTRIYRNNSDGTFTRDTTADADLPQLYVGGVAWGDYDNDGWLDFALSGRTYETGILMTRIYHNNGDGTFTRNTAANLKGVCNSTISWGDYNNDGRLDLLVNGGDINGSSYLGTYIYRNDGNGVFTEIGADFEGLRIGQSLWGDINGDGKLDVLATGINADHPATHLYINHAPVTNTPPTAPSGLAAVVCPGSVTLGWDAATDAQTPSAGLTYNLRIGSTPGGSDIFSGMADASGLRRLPALGNTGLNRSWTAQLPHNGGTYYWSVQAVDGALAGGPWAADESFGPDFPAVVTAIPSNITDTAAGYGGEVTAEGGAPVTARGICWGVNSTPTLANNVTSHGTGTGSFSGSLANLIPGQTYYVRAYASNSYGLAYGAIQSFTTLYLPVVTTDPPTNVTQTTADCGGDVISEGAYPVTTRGFCWSTNSNPTTADSHTSDATGAGYFSHTLMGLTPGLVYHVRAYAINSYGTAYGSERFFSTPMTPPGNALAFDGTNSYVNVGHGPAFNLGNVLTIEAWIKADNLTSRYGIFSTRLKNEPGSFQLEVGPGSEGTNCVTVKAPLDWVAQTVNNVIAPGQWTHIVYVRTGTAAANQQIYVNGVAQALAISAGVAFQDNTSDKVIGEGAVGSEHFPGQIDELRVWNVARTEDQISDNMHRELTGNETGLAAYYRFDEVAGTTLVDLTNNNTGTLVGMSDANWVASTIPCATLGANNENLRGAWMARTNSLASSILSVSNAVLSGTDFRVFGHNGAALTSDTPDKPAGYTWRLDRAWQTEGNGALSGALSFDCSSLTGSIQNPSLLRLMVSPDGTFAHAAGVEGTYNGTVFTVAGQALPANGWYTLGERIAANWVINASAGANGTIAPAGNVQVMAGGTTNFVITPDTYWHVSDVAINGASVGAVTSFTWSNVTADGVIHAEFAAGLAAGGTPHWWLAQHGWTSDFDAAEASDTDHDGQSAGQEYAADTDPTDSASYFHIESVTYLPPLEVTVASSATRLYTLYRKTGLTAGGWLAVPGQTDVPGTGGPLTLRDTNPPPPRCFYRLEVRLP